jgi:hypothetical protein
MPTLHKTARITGLLYVILIGAGLFAGFSRISLEVPGDAQATYSNIVAAEGLFRATIAGDLVMIICDVALVLLFYVLLKAVSPALSLLAAFFRLAQAATLGLNLLALFLVLELIGGVAYVEASQVPGLVALLLKAHGVGYNIGLVFFGVFLILQAYLMLKASYFPNWLSGLIFIAGLSYLLNSFSFLYPAYADLSAMLMVAPTILAEVSLALYLLIKGVDAPIPTETW